MTELTTAKFIENFRIHCERAKAGETIYIKRQDGVFEFREAKAQLETPKQGKSAGDRGLFNLGAAEAFVGHSVGTYEAKYCGG